MLIDINMKDELKNTLIHHLFQNFSSNMEMSVEVCQELLKIGERMGESGGAIKLNEPNKNGQTPIDLAIEIKQN